MRHPQGMNENMYVTSQTSSEYRTVATDSNNGRNRFVHLNSEICAVHQFLY